MPFSSSSQFNSSVFLAFSNFFGSGFVCFPPPQGSNQAWLEEVPAESRGLRITEVVFFLITYKNRDKANHQPCDFLQHSGSLNSLKKARISTFPTAWYVELQSSLSAILLWEGEGGRGIKRYHLTP